jgi:hypothetical protein
VDPAGELAQLVQGGAELGVRLGEEVGGAVCVRAELRAGELEREAEREQPLLGAAVEVALEPSPLLIAGTDDARPRGAQLGELCAQLCLQSLVLEREPGGRPRSGEQRASLEQHRVVDERGDRRLGGTEHGHRPLRTGCRQREWSSLCVDV